MYARLCVCDVFACRVQRKILLLDSLVRPLLPTLDQGGARAPCRGSDSPSDSSPITLPSFAGSVVFHGDGIVKGRVEVLAQRIVGRHALLLKNREQLALDQAHALDPGRDRPIIRWHSLEGPVQVVDNGQQAANQVGVGIATSLAALLLHFACGSWPCRRRRAASPPCWPRRALSPCSAPAGILCLINAVLGCRLPCALLLSRTVSQFFFLAASDAMSDFAMIPGTSTFIESPCRDRYDPGRVVVVVCTACAGRPMALAVHFLQAAR